MPELTELKSWLWVDYEEVSSTNDIAYQLSKNIQPKQKTVVTAQKQTKGRGRRGRDWISLEGNLFMSMLFPCSLQESGAMPLMTSLAILNTVLRLSPQAQIKLKWPNDVLLNNCKLSGILLERGEKDSLIIGVGINIKKNPDPAAMLYPTTCLMANGINCNRIQFLKLFLDEFDKIHEQYTLAGMPMIASLWLKHAKGINSPVVVHTPKGEERGLFKGLNLDGMMQLETSDGKIKIISAGDVFFDDNGEDEK